MQLNEIKSSIINRDRTIKVISKDGKFRAVFVKNTNASITAQISHKINDVATYFLSRLLTGASMLAALLKGEERVVLDIDAKGYISGVVVEAMQLGEVRGYVRINNENIKQVNNDDLLLGAGFLRVTKIMYNKSQPIQGIVNLQYGDVANDLAYYFAQSEQIPTFLQMETEFDDKGNIILSAGYMVQSMPDATEKDIELMYEKLTNAKAISNLLKEGLSPEETLKELLPFEYNVLTSTPLDFFCRCSKDLFKSKLITLDKSEIIDMADNNQNELVCQYCSKHYYLTNEDFNELIADKQAKLN